MPSTVVKMQHIPHNSARNCSKLGTRSADGRAKTSQYVAYRALRFGATSFCTLSEQNRVFTWFTAVSKTMRVVRTGAALDKEGQF